MIGIVALVVIGPKELPGALRTLGQWMTKIRRMASEFQNQFHEAMREAELADLKKDVDEMAATAQSYANINPMDDLRKDIESAITPPSEFDSSLSKLSSTTSTAKRCMLGTEGSAGQGRRRLNACRIGRRVTIALPNSRRSPCGASTSVAMPFTTV